MMRSIPMRAAAGIAAFAAALLFAAPLHAGQMELTLRQLLRHSATPGSASWSKAVPVEGGVRMAPCLLQTRDAKSTAAAIAEAGGTSSQPVAAREGNAIVAARIPIDAAAAIAARPEVIAVEAGLPLHPKMDTARIPTNVVAVQDGSGLGLPYDGTNVIVGSVDDGLDYGNPDFLRGSGITRVQYVRQADASGVTECTHSQIAAGSCGIPDNGQGTVHGTHVMGIAAGSNATFTGVAPAADIMFDFDSATDADTGGTFATAVIEGVSAIFAKADLMDKPAVVNLSLGTSIGAHDGTSLMEQGLDALAMSRPGRIIVNAAGNEQLVPAQFPAAVRDNLGGIHAPIAAASESRGWRLGVWSGRGAASAFTGGTLIDVWLEPGQKDACSIALFGYLPDRSPINFAFPGITSTDNASLVTGDVGFAADTPSPVTATAEQVTATVEINAADPRNGKPHAQILISPEGSSLSAAAEGMWYDVVIRAAAGGTCTGHMWLYFDYTGYHDFLRGVAGAGHDVAAGAAQAGYVLGDGDSLYTTTIPATAISVIAAGSYMPEKPIGSGVSQWTGDNGTTYLQSDVLAPGGSGSVTGDLSGFSSLGPTADGRQKPDVVTPGEPIISTKARGSYEPTSVTVGGEHFKSAGTSMASPFLSGIVALLLQRNNTLGVEQVRGAIKAGAVTAGMTVKTPDPVNSYGAGKVDAVAILQSVVADNSAYHGDGDLDGGGGGGCSLVSAASRVMPAGVAAAVFAVITIAPLLRRRGRGPRQ